MESLCISTVSHSDVMFQFHLSGENKAGFCLCDSGSNREFDHALELQVDLVGMIEPVLHIQMSEGRNRLR